MLLMDGWFSEAAEFPELDDIPQRQVTLKEAVRAQSVVLKAKKKCDSRCHKASASCKNNWSVYF